MKVEATIRVPGAVYRVNGAPIPEGVSINEEFELFINGIRVGVAGPDGIRPDVEVMYALGSADPHYLHTSTDIDCILEFA